MELLIKIGDEILSLYYYILSFLDDPVSAQPIAKPPTSLRKSTTFPIDSAKLEEKASNVIPPSNVSLLDKDDVPVLDENSSSLMEGSGEFDPTFFSESNPEPQESNQNTVSLLPNESSTSDTKEIRTTICDFETTNLVVSVDDNDQKETKTKDLLEKIQDYSSNVEGNSETTSEIGIAIPNANLSTSVSTMSNSAASSTLTVTSKSSTIGLSNYENVGSESSELNSSVSSSNTTLFAPKISTEEGGDTSDEKNPIVNQNEKFDLSSQVGEQSNGQNIIPLNSTSDVLIEENIISQPKMICDNTDELEVNVIDVKSDEEDSNGSVSNQLANAMVDDSQKETDKDERLKNKYQQDNLTKHSQNDEQVSPPESQCSSIESSSKSYELVKHASMVSLQASTSSSFNVISKFSTNEESFQQNQNHGRLGPNSSEHTSGDELELATTATSSDIEVISSPILGSENGNGNGHRNLHVNMGHPDSPRKGGSSQLVSNDKKLKELHSSKHGHARSSSEISGISACSDSADSAKPDTTSGHESRTHKFQKKINDLKELLEAREVKLVELSKQNMDLQEKNEDLVSQVKEARKINTRLSETHLASEEFTQRLSSMEQRLHQTISERDNLKEENRKMKQEAATRMSKGQVEEILTEKDEIITDLRAEGESLSKKVGKQSEVIKKIRQTEKGLEKELKSTKEKLEKKTEECERFKKSLAAKGEMETKQIEAVRDLTNANTTWQEEAKKRDSELEDAKDQTAALKLSLESAFKEMASLRKTLAERDDEAKEEELIKVQKIKKELQEELRRNKELAIAETDSLQRTIDELRYTLADEERASTRREEHLRRERDDIQQRLAMSDARHDELSGSVSTATRPLLRQIESLQLSLSEAQANADRAERGLGERLQQTTIQLASCQERERATAEQYRQVSARLATMDSRLENSKQAQAEAEARSESLSTDVARLESAIHKENVAIKALRSSFAEEVAELKKEKDGLETAFESEKLVTYEEKRKVEELTKQLSEKDKKLKEVSERDLENLRRMSENANRNSVSPSPSLSSMSQKGHSFDVENENDERGSHWMVSYKYFCSTRILTLKLNFSKF